MVSPELIRRFPLFADFNLDQVHALALASEEIFVEQGHYFFQADDDLDKFYFVVEGKVSVVIGVPDRNHEHKLADQLYNHLVTEDVVVSTVEMGEMFGWSALIPPYKSTAGAKAAATSRVLAFDCQELRKLFDQDCKFAYLMVLKAAQTTRERLRSMQIESLAYLET